MAIQLGIFVFAVFSLIFLLAGNFQLPSTQYFAMQGKPSSVHTAIIESLSMTYGKLKSTSMLPWDIIVEPYQAYSIKLVTFPLGDEDMDPTTSDDYKVMWEIDGDEFYGTQFSIIKRQYGVYSGKIKVFQRLKSMDLSEKTSDMSLIYSQDLTVAVKYVRREIRSLTNSHRELVMDSIRKMYSLSQEEGIELYGDSFRSAETILLTHLTSAGALYQLFVIFSQHKFYATGMTNCDHWHDGAGFLTHHTALTLMVERTLQAIDPSLALPYWDYGIDSTEYSIDTFSQSPIFQPDWFGEASPSNPTHTIADGGFWSKVTFPDGEKYLDNWDIASTGSLNPHVNGYGHLRSPWNNNPSRGISRRNSTYGVQRTYIPSCKEFKRCFQKKTLREVRTRCYLLWSFFIPLLPFLLGR